MKKFKKVVLLAAAVLLIGILPALAADSAQFQVETVSAQCGDTVEVGILVKNSPGTTSTKLRVTFDDALTLESVTYGTEISGSFIQPQKKSSPVVLNWANGLEDFAGDYRFATLTFTVAADASEGLHAVSVTYDPDDVYNVAEDNVDFAVVNGGVRIAGTEDVDDTAAFAVETVEAQRGDTVEVNVRVKNSPGITSTKLWVTFDNALTLESVVYGTEISGSFVQPQRMTSPVILNWANGLEDYSGDYLFATLTFSVAQDASEGVHTVSVSYDPDDVYNVEEDNVDFAVISGGVKISVGCVHTYKAGLCTLCGHDSVEVAVDSGVLTVTCDELESGTYVCLAVYDGNGRFAAIKYVALGEALALPEGERHVLFFVNNNWVPLRGQREL